MSDSSFVVVVLIAASFGLLAMGGCAAPGNGPMSLAANEPVRLAAADLYNGFDARRVLPDAAGRSVVLDGRVFDPKLNKVAHEGWIVTDPIDVGPRVGLIGESATVNSIAVAVDAAAPEGASVTVAARTGPNALSEAGWTNWVKLNGLTGTVAKPAGRYVQVKITLTAADQAALPAVRSLTLTPAVQTAPGWAGSVRVAASDVQRIVRSPIDFQYERPDQKDLVWLRKAAKLDEVVAGAKDDFEKLVRLTDWAGGLANERGDSRMRDAKGRYCWDIRKVVEDKAGKLVVHGHCMSFAEVLVTAASAMGYVSARHNSNVGFRRMSHETVDVWCPSLGKWVYLDPSLTQYYYDLKTKTPLNMIEMHKIVADRFVPAGKDMNWFTVQNSQETREVVRKVGGQSPIGARTGPWRYGEPMDPGYDWGWYHGYLAAGRVQMTPRNDFHSHPEAASLNFENEPGYDSYPNWVDDKTPPVRGGENWYTRMRDFYWTLDQASFTLVKGSQGTLNVELGNSMPYFKSYRVTIDGKPVQQSGRTLAWNLHEGQNTLTVLPVDVFGKVGLPSSVTVTYAK
ncbi:MAG: hypothetical protein BIFFINMI_00749 [Phycisphaerae bacterium]|nr:hypothetical protein [Phycisphaerae bacterium]